jgi:hypothetical protein
MVVLMMMMMQRSDPDDDGPQPGFSADAGTGALSIHW